MDKNKSILSIGLIMDFTKLLKSYVFFVIPFVFIITLLSIIFELSIPRKYTSITTMVPEANNENSILGNSMGVLSNIVGLKNNSSTDAIYPELYPKIIKSTKFKLDIFGSKVYYHNRQVTIYDYFLLDQEEPWFSIKSQKDTLLSYDKQKISSVRWNKQQQSVSQAIDGAISCMVDKKTDIITISTECQDPEVAQQITSIVKQKLQSYITEYRTSKAKNDVAYYQKLYNESKAAYEKVRQKYVSYSDANEDIILPSVEAKKEDLENDMQLKYNIYTQMTVQLQQSKAKLQERTPAFTTIQPPTVPFKPSYPKRMITVFMTFIASFLIAVCICLTYRSVKSYLRKQA